MMKSKFSDSDLREIIAKMTVRQKAAQMTQLNANLLLTDADGEITGPAAEMNLTKEDVATIGSTLNYRGANNMISLQREHLKSDPNKIPLLGMMDVIHGCKTIYPVPLALGCTFEPDLVRDLCAMAAKESAACGIQVTFSPMVDLARDARWGRVVETTGEDPFMNCLYAKAAVKGYQGDDLSDNTKIAACLKHFAAYGAVEAGRDYNTVDMSERTAREFYLKAYQAAVDAGIALAMTSFNVYDGIPLTANKELTQGVLKGEWGFDGVIISDYNAFGEMCTHGYEKEGENIALRAYEAGEDIEMMSLNYLENMEKLVSSGKIDEKDLDEYVFRILKLKRDLGVFDDPERGVSVQREESECLTSENRALAKKAAEKSCVLLKNDGVLPLDKADGIALIGPFADSGDILGTWRCYGDASETTTVYSAMKKACANVAYAKGCGYELKDFDKSGFEEAVALARRSKTVVMCVGEYQDYSGESKSRADITIPANQVELIRQINRVNDNIVIVCFGGRPLVINEVLPLCKAFVMAWQPGTEGGSAITDLLIGKANFEGKLSMTFPYHVAQCPIYYNHMNTGRPKPGEDFGGAYVSMYIDVPNKPLFEYGYGLSYSKFEIGQVKLSSDSMTSDEKIIASVTVSNCSDVDGSEVVQLYLRDRFASRVRPVKELKGYKKIFVKAGESAVVEFEIDVEMLKFWNEFMEYTAEKGEFDVFVGASSDTENSAEFKLV